MTLLERMSALKLGEVLWAGCEQVNSARSIAKILRIEILIGVVSHTISITRVK